MRGGPAGERRQCVSSRAVHRGRPGATGAADGVPSRVDKRTNRMQSGGNVAGEASTQVT